MMQPLFTITVILDKIADKLSGVVKKSTSLRCALKRLLDLDRGLFMGVPGLNGEPGPPGVDGLPGPPGLRGDNGSDGEDGTGVTFLGEVMEVPTTPGPLGGVYFVSSSSSWVIFDGTDWRPWTVNGVQGPAGEAPRWQGAYQSLVTYRLGDIVRFQNAIYAYGHTVPSAGNEPSLTSAYWMFLNADGPQGSKGDPGPPGPSGGAITVASTLIVEVSRNGVSVDLDAIGVPMQSLGVIMGVPKIGNANVTLTFNAGSDAKRLILMTDRGTYGGSDGMTLTLNNQTINQISQSNGFKEAMVWYNGVMYNDTLQMTQGSFPTGSARPYPVGSRVLRIPASGSPSLVQY